MKKFLQYLGFALVVFVLLTIADFLSGDGWNPAYNGARALIALLIFYGYDFFRRRKKDAQ